MLLSFKSIEYNVGTIGTVCTKQEHQSLTCGDMDELKTVFKIPKKHNSIQMPK